MLDARLLRRPALAPAVGPATRSLAGPAVSVTDGPTAGSLSLSLTRPLALPVLPTRPRLARARSEYNEAEEDARQETDGQREEIKNRNAEDYNMLRDTLERVIKRIEEDFDTAHANYMANTVRAPSRPCTPPDALALVVHARAQPWVLTRGCVRLVVAGRAIGPSCPAKLASRPPGFAAAAQEARTAEFKHLTLQDQRSAKTIDTQTRRLQRLKPHYSREVIQRCMLKKPIAGSGLPTIWPLLLNATCRACWWCGIPTRFTALCIDARSLTASCCTCHRWQKIAVSHAIPPVPGS